MSGLYEISNGRLTLRYGPQPLNMSQAIEASGDQVRVSLFRDARDKFEYSIFYIHNPAPGEGLLRTEFITDKAFKYPTSGVGEICFIRSVRAQANCEHLDGSIILKHAIFVFSCSVTVQGPDQRIVHCELLLGSVGAPAG